MKKKVLKITVVCATANGKYKLPNLIKSISDGSYIPNEIIVVATKIGECYFLKKNLNSKINLKIIISKKKNQIYQRNLGKKIAKNNIIIQTDDDVIFTKNTIKNFYYEFRLNKTKKIIAAYVLILKKKFHQSTRFYNLYKKFFFFRFFLKFLNEFKQIKNFSILASGRIVPLINNINNQKFENVDWLNSVMMYDKRLANNHKIKTNNIKSYYEDVMFSFYNKLNGFKLIISKKITVYHPEVEKTNLQTFLKSIKAQYLLSKMRNGSFAMYILDILIFSVVFILYK